MALDEIEAAHRSIGGSGPGRRYATLQINHAYAVLVLGQFQAFSRDLHSEAIDFLATRATPPGLGGVLRLALGRERRLDRGNPTPDNIADDFTRFSIRLWADVAALDPRNVNRKAKLLELTRWRNAIAHQDWTKTAGPEGLRLGTVRAWRSACGGLARSFDHAIANALATVVGVRPW